MFVLKKKKKNKADLRMLNFALGGCFVMVTTVQLCAWRLLCNGYKMNVERSDDGLQGISSNVGQSDGQLL